MKNNFEVKFSLSSRALFSKAGQYCPSDCALMTMARVVRIPTVNSGTAESFLP